MKMPPGWKVDYNELGAGAGLGSYLYKLVTNKRQQQKEKERKRGSRFLLQKNDADLLSATPLSVNISMEEHIVSLDKHCLSQWHGVLQHCLIHSRSEQYQSVNHGCSQKM